MWHLCRIERHIVFDCRRYRLIAEHFHKERHSSGLRNLTYQGNA